MYNDTPMYGIMDSENIYFIGTIYTRKSNIHHVYINYTLFTNDIFYVYIMTNEEKACNIKLYFKTIRVCMCFYIIKEMQF